MVTPEPHEDLDHRYSTEAARGRPWVANALRSWEREATPTDLEALGPDTRAAMREYLGHTTTGDDW